jgi:hypothetical protein
MVNTAMVNVQKSRLPRAYFAVFLLDLYYSNTPLNMIAYLILTGTASVLRIFSIKINMMTLNAPSRLFCYITSNAKAPLCPLQRCPEPSGRINVALDRCAKPGRRRSKEAEWEGSPCASHLAARTALPLPIASVSHPQPLISDRAGGGGHPDARDWPASMRRRWRCSPRGSNPQADRACGRARTPRQPRAGPCCSP